jgi:CheY-like chemotaxis protein
MNAKEWDELVNSVKRQIDDLRSALEQNEVASAIDKEVLEKARQDVEHLIDTPSNPREVLYQLPITLQALSTQKLIGVFLIGNDGKVVLQHGSSQRFMKIDPLTHKLPTGCFYDGTTGLRIEEASLPWSRCLRGEEIPQASHVVLKDPKGSSDEEVHVEVSVVPLRNDEAVSGVVTLFRDKTETIKAGQYIKELCFTLEKQVSGIEAAQRELKKFAETVMEITGSRPALPAEAVAQADPAPRELGGARVLVVDDIPVNQKLLCMHLKKFGVQADLACNGAEAVEACKLRQYPLVLMDLDMPILNGFEATAEIRKHESAHGGHTAIVAITSFDRPEDRAKCLKEGMDDFMPKGAGQAKLRAVVGKYVLGEPDEITAAGLASEEQPDQTSLKLDRARLQDMLGGDTEKVVTLFLGSAAMLLNCLEFSLDEKDAKGVMHFAYSFKGPCSSMGLGMMARKADDLVADTQAGRWTEARLKFNVLRGMFNTVNKQAASMSAEQRVAFPV